MRHSCVLAVLWRSQIILIVSLQVPCEAFLTAARSMKRQITPEVLAKFAAWGSKYEGQK